MQSSPKSVGLFVALVVTTLLFVGWPGPEEQRAPEAPPVLEWASPAPGPVFLVEGDVWKLPQYGLRMTLPAGWTPRERQGRPFLYKEPEAPLSGSINVLWLPNLRGLDFEGLREENRVTLERTEGLELISIEELAVSDVRALRIDYRGASRRGEPVRFLGVVMLRGARQIVVTGAGLESEWGELEGTLLACLGSLETLP